VKKKIIAILIAVAVVAGGIMTVPLLADSATGSITHVQLTPASVTLVTGTTQQYTAQALDSSNQPVSSVNYFWLVADGGGTITTTGLFTAGTVGNYSNTVEVVAVQGTTAEIATASVTVVASIGSLDHIAITPATATLAPSGTQQFAAQGYDSNNAAIPGLTYVWSLGTGASGTISTSGLYTAGTTTGTVTIQAKVQGATTPTGSATVTVSTTPPVTTTSSGSQGRCSIIGLFRRYFKNVGSGNFLGGQWQVKNSSGGIDTYKLIPGVVQTASTTSLVIVPNGQTATSTFALTTSTVIQPSGVTLIAGDMVMVLTVNDQVTTVSIINASPTTQTTRTQPGLNKNDNNNGQGNKVPPGWSHGKKNGWHSDSSRGDSDSNGD